MVTSGRRSGEKRSCLDGGRWEILVSYAARNSHRRVSERCRDRGVLVDLELHARSASTIASPERKLGEVDFCGLDVSRVD